MAAALALIADRIDYHIFAPIYTSGENEGIRELLFQHAEVDIKREAACRALVLSGYTEDDQRRAAEGLVRDVTNQVSSLLRCLLGPSLIDGFTTELEKLIHDSMTLWWPAQRSSLKIDTSVEDMDGEGWNDLNIFDSAVESPTSDRFQIALFPRVVIAQEGGLRLVFPGAALWESQTAAAEEEWKEHKEAIKAARRPTTLRGQGSNGGDLRRERRLSLVDGYRGALRSPTSPTNTSFLDRRQSSGTGRGDG
jgi:hypothetical protein